MISALLFDLDDTLLGNDLGTFLPAYLQALVQHLALGPESGRFLTELVNGTRAMIDSADPARTMRAVFGDYFFPALGWEASTGWPRFDDFYRTRFPALQRLTTPRAAARAVMHWAFAQNYQVAIATSPLFPLAAIRERLRWAGIDDFPYALITSYETSHFAKPHPEYFAEILACLGRRPDEALLIGNDWSDDLTPAARLSLPAFWIAPAGSALPAHASTDGVHPVGIGDLDVFLDWAKTHLPHLPLPPQPSPTLPPLLAGNLAAVIGSLAGLPDSAWIKRPAEGEWSLTEIICHLRDVEREVHFPRLRSVVDMDDPFLAGADTDPWAVGRHYSSQSGPQALQDFITARKQTYIFLGGEPASAWSRPARHAIFGPTHLAEIVGWMLDHDRIHLEQLRTTRQKISADSQL